MGMPLGCRSNVREVLKFLDVIEATEATDFTTLPKYWGNLSLRAIDYHPGRTCRGGDFFLDDPWRRHTIDEKSAHKRVDAMRVIPCDLKCGCVQVEEHVERTPPDDTRDYHPIYGWPHSWFHAWATASNTSNPVTSGDDVAETPSVAPVVTDDTAPVCRFLENVGVIRSDGDSMMLSKMNAYVRDFLMH